VTVVDVRPGRDARSLVEVVVHEGRKHVVPQHAGGRGTCRSCGWSRTQFGPLASTDWRPASTGGPLAGEVAALYETVGL